MDTEAFRTQYRAEQIGPNYRGWLHFAFTTVGSWTVILWALSRVHQPSWGDLLVVPGGFFIANVAEYLGHKGPMHHPNRLLKIIYQRHTLEHHQFFTHEEMSYESSRDFKMVLFPPEMLFFFLGGLATPIAAAFYFLVSPNAGFLFGAVGMGYFILYEWLHFAYHLPPSSWISRLGPIRVLRRHHVAHHNQRLMSKWNFNITFPIGDALFGTFHRGE